MSKIKLDETMAAALNLPLVDAPANGRAHPTGLMGAMGLHRKKNYHSIQSAVGGYDLGLVAIEGDRAAELTFWNEFMTLEIDGNREATFPDLITLLSLETGLPVSSAELAEGHEIAVLAVSRENLILGKGVLLPETLAEAENAIGKPLVDI